MMNNKYSTENILNEIRKTGEILSKIDSANISKNYLVLEKYLRQLQDLKQLFDNRYLIYKENNNISIVLITYFLYDYILDIFNNIGTDVEEYTPIEIWIKLLNDIGNDLISIADSVESDNKGKCFESSSKLIRHYYIALDDKWRRSYEEITAQ